MQDSSRNLRSVAIQCFHTKLIRKKVVRGIQSINQRQFARMPVTFALVACVDVYAINRIRLLCLKIQGIPRRSTSIAKGTRCWTLSDICDCSICRREDGITIVSSLPLYKRHSCCTIHFPQKLQVTLKAQKADKTLGCCEFDGMFVWYASGFGK